MTAPAPAKPQSAFSQKWRDGIFLSLVLAIGSTLTLLTVSSLQQTQNLRLKERITAVNQEVVSAFELEMTRTTQAIRSAGLMLEANPQLTREQFNRYMQKLVENQLSVNLMEWQPIVPADRLAQFEADARAAGLNAYRVLEPAANGKDWQPVHGRDEYVPVLFAWPETYRTIGLDMSFSPERMASKLQSRSIAQPVASGTFEFIKEGMLNSGTMAMAISTTVFSADHQARGYLAAVVDLPTLFEKASHLADTANFDLLVFPADTSAADPIYVSLADDSDLKQSTTDLHQATAGDGHTRVNFAHQSWNLVLHPRPAFHAGLRSNAALLAFAAGMGMTFLLLAILIANLRLNARLRSEMASRTAADKVLQHQQLMMERSESMARLASFEWDVDSNVVTWSPEMFRIFGRSPAQGIPNLEGQVELYTPESTQELFATVRTAVAEGTPYELELMTVQPDGEQRPCLVKGFPERDESGRVVRLAGLVQDITERKRAESEINNLAFYDPLTRLPNRRLLLDRLRQALASSARHQHYGALLFIDLDHFKGVNDTLGHDVGDLLLQQVAERLSTLLRGRDTVGRLGGDEFVVMLENLSEVATEAATEAKLVGEKILALLNQPYELNGYLQHISPSIGITLFTDFHGSTDDLLKQADLAMYRAKANGRNTVCFFDQQMQTVVMECAVLERDLR